MQKITIFPQVKGVKKYTNLLLNECIIQYTFSLMKKILLCFYRQNFTVEKTLKNFLLYFFLKKIYFLSKQDMTIDICQFPFIISPISLFIVWVLFWYGKSMGFGCKKRIEFFFIPNISTKNIQSLMYKRKVSNDAGFFLSRGSCKLKVFIE